MNRDVGQSVEVRRRTKRHQLHSLRLLVVTCLALVSAPRTEAQQAWMIPLTVTQAGNSAVDTFGAAIGATYCMDAWLGETELPPLPPAGYFDVRFVDSPGYSCLGQGARLHIQQARDDTFRLAFQKGAPAESTRWTISWPIERTCAWLELYLTDALGRGLVNVDMKTVSSVTIEDSAVTSVDIIGRGMCEDCCPDAVGPERDPLPKSFGLEQNFPNPFNSQTTISYALPREALVRLSIMNLLGVEVALLTDKVQSAGRHTVTWDASGVPGGVYYCRMQAGEFTETKKVMFIK